MKPKFPTPCLCYIVDGTTYDQTPLDEVLDQGVNMVQIREKESPIKPILTLAHKIRNITSGSALLVVNQHIDIALDCDADGVQLSERSQPQTENIRQTIPDLLIGCSVHSLKAALTAEASGADFLVVGTIFTSKSHPLIPPTSPGLLSSIAQSTRIPFIAIGGINSANVNKVIEAGAWGAAVISTILSSKDPGQTSKKLKEVMKESWCESTTAYGRPTID